MKKLTPHSYEEFLDTFRMDVPATYNFAFDSFDPIAERHPERKALVHVGPDHVRRDVSFGFLRRESCRLANALQEMGVAKGDRIMLILFRRIEFWTAMLALHRLGAVAVPSPNLLTTKDIVYRANFGKLRGVICEDSQAAKVQAARADAPTLAHLVQTGPGEPQPGWARLEDLRNQAADDLDRKSVV